jgi:hypothetical protein
LAVCVVGKTLPITLSEAANPDSAPTIAIAAPDESMSSERSRAQSLTYSTAQTP